MSQPLKVSRVFVPGKLPEVTYNPRSERGLERRIEDYLDEGGAIFTLAGPTKTGKSVLLQRVMEHPVWLDGQGITDVHEMWRRIGDQLGLYTDSEVSRGSTQGGTAQGSAEFAVPMIAKSTVSGEWTASDEVASRQSVARPISSVAVDGLKRSKRPLVIDDFHFIEVEAQRQIVRALKPLVLAGLPIFFISISHRVRDVVTAEPDMTGRVEALTIDLWSKDELISIARRGFRALNLLDPEDRVATVLAANSWGSPHLMQKFCREICKANGHREAPALSARLEPPTGENWSAFFSDQVDNASRSWFQRLLRGPQERSAGRRLWELADGRKLDGYGLTLAAIASTGPKLALSKDSIKKAIEELVDGHRGPELHQTTRVLLNMTKIAQKRAGERLPFADELDDADADASVPEVQPVMEYIDDGPNSVLHIADPFFAYCIRWGSATLLPGNQERPPRPMEDPLF